MRLGHALVLTRMLMRFFVRKVLSAGALRSPVVRGLLGTGAVLLAVVCTGAAYLFLRPMVDDRDVWALVLQTTTVSALLWTQCAFLFVKVLFLNSEGLLELSFHLPLTGRERAVALLAYEAVMVCLVAGVGLFSISAATVLLLGPGAVGLLLQTIVVPVLVTYGVLSLLHVGVLRTLERTRLRRVSHLVAILAVFVLMLGYSRQLSSLVGAVSQRYLRQDRSFTPLTAPTWLADAYGDLAFLVLAGVLVTALFIAVLAVTPRQYVRPSRYVKLWRGSASARAHLTPYDRCLLRSSQTWLSALAAGSVFLALCLRPVVNPVWALSLLPMGGLYLFAASEPLRAAGWDRAPAGVVYVRLMRAQLLLVAGGMLVALPLTWALVPSSVPGAGPAVGGAVLATVLSTFIGVTFPAANDNPFSIFLGISATAMVGFILAATLGILQLDLAFLVAALVLLTAVVTAYTIIGIRLNHTRSRHEEVAADPQQRDRWAAAHGHRRSGNLALPHVLHR